MDPTPEINIIKLGECPEFIEKALVSPCEEASKTVSLVPRAINAALSGLEKWILHRENNIAITKKLLQIKLENVHPDKIVPPEPYVAIPALQAIEYCMDYEELRDMFASLLASSINVDKKDDVHPSFVEIIKQMDALDANIFRHLVNTEKTPIVQLAAQLVKGSGETIFFTNFMILDSISVDFEKNAASLENLFRLKLINIDYMRHYIDDKLYDIFNSHPEILSRRNYLDENNKNIKDSTNHRKLHIQKGMVSITPFGRMFALTCL